MKKDDVLWCERLDLFEEFIIQNNRLPQARDKIKGFDIGNWLRYQINVYKNGNLNQYRFTALNHVNKYWNGTVEEKLEENKRLLINSDWKSKVSSERTPIDFLYSDDKLYICLSNGILDLEGLINAKEYIKSKIDFDIFECYSKIIGYLNPNYARFIYEVYADYVDLYNIESVKSFFEEFLFRSQDQMLILVDKLLETITEREALVLSLYYGLKDKRRYKTISSVSRELCLSCERIRQIKCVAIRKLRHPYRRDIILNSSNKFLNSFSSSIRNLLIINNIYSESDFHKFINDKFDEDKADIILSFIEYKNRQINNINDEINTYIKERNERFIIELTTEINELDLSLRTRNCLVRAGIFYLGELIEICKGENFDRLLKIRNLGKYSIFEISIQLDNILNTNEYKLKYIKVFGILEFEKYIENE